MPLKTPVALCIFNRPETTRQVFRQIARVQPERLLVFADGPRPHVRGESTLAQAAREIASQVDWPCDLRCWFSDINLGCQRRMQSGLDWVFDQTERAIILEDDTVPSISFFRFCEQLLDRYAHDPRVMMISGNHFQPPSFSTKGSYYFSKWPHIWGWASWRRAWRFNREAGDRWQSATERKAILEAVFPRPDERSHWTGALEAYFAGQIDTWDFGWCYAIWAQRGLTALPSRNLVSNIGFGDDATHTTDSSSPWANLPAEEIDHLVHPAEVCADEQADRWTFENVFAPGPHADGSPWVPVRSSRRATRTWQRIRKWLQLPEAA